VIAVPPFDPAYLARGHAIHFRCHREDVRDMRVDVMSKMRGVAPFAELWERRTTIENSDLKISVMALPDLVQAKKTQRDKDWPMIRRLVDEHYFSKREAATERMVEFWFRELRTAELLIEAAQARQKLASTLSAIRPLLTHAINSDASAIESSLALEEAAERKADHDYWRPLREELQKLRRERLR
jgi:hypothetical protein